MVQPGFGAGGDRLVGVKCRRFAEGGDDAGPWCAVGGAVVGFAQVVHGGDGQVQGGGDRGGGLLGARQRAGVEGVYGLAGVVLACEPGGELFGLLVAGGGEATAGGRSADDLFGVAPGLAVSGDEQVGGLVVPAPATLW